MVLDRRTDGYARYVSEIVMWPWPLGAADHAGRHVDRSDITDWLRRGCLRHRWTEMRLSGSLFLLVQGRRSIRLDHLGPIVELLSELDTLHRPQAYSRYRERKNA